MADSSSIMDWAPQTPPPRFNPYPGQYVPGGWPATPPPPQTTGLFDPPRKRTYIEHVLGVLPVAKRACTFFVRTTFNVAAAVVTVPTITVVRRVQQMRRARAARPQRRQQLRNRVVALRPEQPAIAVPQVVNQAPPTPPSTPLPEPKVEVISIQKKQEKRPSFPYKVPEFRPAYVLNNTYRNVPPKKIVGRRGIKNVFPSIPRLAPPQVQKPLILDTPEQIVAKPLPEADRVQLQSPFPQLIPEPATALSPPSPAATFSDDETATPSTQLQGDLYDDTPAAKTSSENDLEEASIVSSVTNSRKRRSNTQGSRATPNGESSSSKRLQTLGPSAASPITPTPNHAIVVQDTPVAVGFGNRAYTPADTSLLTPTRFKNRKFSTPKSLLKTLHKKPQTPLADDTILSSTCSASPGNYHIDEVRSPAKSEISSFFQGTPPQHLVRVDEARSPAKSEISSFFQGTPPQNPEGEADEFRMITAGGGGSPVPTSRNTTTSENTTGTTGSSGQDAHIQSSDATSTGNKSAVEETEENIKHITSDLAGATTEMTETHSGLANQDATPEPYKVAAATEQTSSTDDNESPVVPSEANTSTPIDLTDDSDDDEAETATTSTPIDLTDDNEDDGEAEPSSTSTASGPATPEKLLAKLKLDDDKYHTPDRPTPKAELHSVERTTRKTRAETKREQQEQEKHLYNIVALTAEWEDKIQQALREGHGDFKRTDFARVVPTSSNNRGTELWLNDEVINGYLALIVKHGNQNDRPTQVPSHHAFSSFFYNTLESKGHDGVRRWGTRAKIGGKNLLETQAVFIPINAGAHWTLLVVSGKERSATHYNSLGGRGGRYIRAVKTWLAGELGAHYKEEEWSFVEAGESPMQANMDDCGVFTITSARQIMLGMTPLSYGPGEIPLQRKRIVAELVAGELLKSNV